jgi:exodeoxyribonuclease III
MAVTLVSWNVNGLRAAGKKGFADWIAAGRYDVVGLQETKITSPEQLPPELASPTGYHSLWSCAKTKKGYSGVALFTRVKPKDSTDFLGRKEFDDEGRTLIADYGRFVLLNVYFPNGGGGPERLAYKLRFYDYFLGYIEKLKHIGRSVVFCGDVNTAHQPVDLARPKENQKNTGFLPEERAWIDKLVSLGWVDTFRHFYPDRAGAYSYWDIKSRARERNVGWRIDYFFITPDLLPFLCQSFILPEVTGSDHCPVGITLDF